MHNQAMVRWSQPLARALLSAIFLYSGVGKIFGFSMIVGYIASAGLPLPSVLAVLTIIVEVGCGVMLLTGFMGRLAAKILFIFTLLTIIFFHNNWSDQLQLIMALKNFAIMGGLLMVFAHGPGPVSIRCWCPKCQNCGKCHLCEDAYCAENHGQ